MTEIAVQFRCAHDRPHTHLGGSYLNHARLNGVVRSGDFGDAAIAALRQLLPKLLRVQLIGHL